MNPIVCTWSLKLPKGSDVVWPDGCRDLIAIIPQTNPVKVICSGLDSSARIISCVEETLFVGVRLSPGVRFPWDQSDVSHVYTDFDLSAYFHSLGHSFNFQTEPQVVLYALSRYIYSCAEPSPAWLANYFQDLHNGDAKRISTLSERSIRRNLVQATGAPPRYWHGLARARKVGLEVCGSDNPLVFIAADYGFSDQAHMTREIKRWFGCSPKRLRANRELAIARLAAPDVFYGL